MGGPQAGRDGSVGAVRALRVVLAALAGLASILPAAPAVGGEACTCAPVDDPAALLDRADVVFRGLAVATDDPTWVFEVEEAFAGPTGRQVEVATEGPCAATFAVGERFLVYATGETAGGVPRDLVTDRCAGTDLAGADDLPPGVAPKGPRDRDRTPALAAIASLVIVAGGGTVLALQIRRARARARS